MSLACLIAGPGREKAVNIRQKRCEKDGVEVTCADVGSAVGCLPWSTTASRARLVSERRTPRARLYWRFVKRVPRLHRAATVHRRRTETAVFPCSEVRPSTTCQMIMCRPAFNSRTTFRARRSLLEAAITFQASICVGCAFGYVTPSKVAVFFTSFGATQKIAP